MSWLDTVIGFALATLGWFIALAIVEVRAERRLGTNPPDPKPVCGCTHHISFHDEKGCHYTYFDQFHRTEQGKCGCVKYVGPEPLPEYLP